MLTDAKLRAALPQDKPYKLTDSHRLYLLVTPSGGKLWRWNYTYDSKQRSLAFGAYPAISLLDARQKRDDARKLLSEGIDPGVAKKLQVKANIQASRNTFEKVAREWHEANAPQWAKRHAADVLRSFERDVFPTLGRLPIAAITPPKILETLRAIEARSAIETAKRIRQRISGVYAYAIACGVAETDPSDKVGAALKPMPRKGRQPAITDIVELRAMLAAVDQDSARPITRLALRLIALTAVRPGELRGAQWSEFENLDGTAPLWRIPSGRMKGDRERKDDVGGDHLVPLAPQSVEVIEAVRQLTGSARLVFPSARHMHHPMSENALGYLLNRAGYHGRHVPHGFRAAFSTIMNEWANQHGREDDRAVIDLMLAHVPSNKIEGAYNRAAYMERRRELACEWARMLVPGLLEPAALLPLKRKHRFGHERVSRLKPARPQLRLVKG